MAAPPHPTVLGDAASASLSVRGGSLSCSSKLNMHALHYVIALAQRPGYAVWSSNDDGMHKTTTTQSARPTPTAPDRSFFKVILIKICQRFHPRTPQWLQAGRAPLPQCGWLSVFGLWPPLRKVWIRAWSSTRTLTTADGFSASSWHFALPALRALWPPPKRLSSLSTACLGHAALRRAHAVGFSRNKIIGDRSWSTDCPLVTSLSLAPQKSELYDFCGKDIAARALQGYNGEYLVQSSDCPPLRQLTHPPRCCRLKGRSWLTGRREAARHTP